MLIVVIIYIFGNLKVCLMKVSNSDTALLQNYCITPELSFHGTKTRVQFNGSCLKQDKVTHSHGTTFNIDTVYEISKN